jgi:hypothetical protein
VWKSGFPVGPVAPHFPIAFLALTMQRFILPWEGSKLPFVLLLLVAILIVMIGGPLALGVTAGAAIALPTWLVWSSGLFKGMFWVVVIGGGLAVLAGIALLVIKIIEPKTQTRSCAGCGHRQPADMRFCFKCSREYNPSA